MTDGRGFREAAAGHTAVPAARHTAPPVRTAPARTAPARTAAARTAAGGHPAAAPARTRVDA
ncbi:hypothetical protein ACIPLC_23960 [Kitasatospora sp. NPDC086801]|uniref:hypothetical protein n=1 Tax=Kitasatospora sp. NPDC086801 TaxID=3364066 RepID=UPI0037F791D4